MALEEMRKAGNQVKQKPQGHHVRLGLFPNRKLYSVDQRGSAFSFSACFQTFFHGETKGCCNYLLASACNCSQPLPNTVRLELNFTRL